MDERNNSKSIVGKPGPAQATNRGSRLKAALKSNMARRKSQAKARAAASVGDKSDQNKQ